MLHLAPELPTATATATTATAARPDATARPAASPTSAATGVLSGGEDDLRRVWQQHGPALTAYVTRLLGGDRYAAEDVVQEVMLRLWRHRDVLREVGSLPGWLRTVARRLVIDRARRRAARPEEVSERGPEPSAPDGSELVLDQLAVREILRAVSPAHGAAVFEVYVRGLSVAQAADRLGVPPGTVKSPCHYALRILRDTTPARVA